LSDFKFWVDDRCDIKNTTNFNYKKWQMEEVRYMKKVFNSSMSMVIGLSSQKKTHVIKAYKIFGLLEDLGGFLGAIEMVLPLIGAYFSTQLFKADFIKSNFKEKKREGKHMQTDFKKIKVPYSYSLLEPIIKPFVSVLCWCRCCKRYCFTKRY
jgi:hypothetical protein